MTKNDPPPPISVFYSTQLIIKNIMIESHTQTPNKMNLYPNIHQNPLKMSLLEATFNFIKLQN